MKRGEQETPNLLLYNNDAILKLKMNKPNKIEFKNLIKGQKTK